MSSVNVLSICASIILLALALACIRLAWFVCLHRATQFDRAAAKRREEKRSVARVLQARQRK